MADGMHEHGVERAYVAGLREFPMLLLVIVPLVALGLWGIPAGARALHGETGKPIGWMSAEWLTGHRASHAP